MEEVHTGNAAQVRLAFRCGYLGEGFFGSQVQPVLRTVEGEFIRACLNLGLFSSHRGARFLAAGRTDRGVHARGQVFAFSTVHPERAVSALNRRLPPDFWTTGYAVVEPGFHPRHHAVSRTYRYYFGEPDLDAEAMDRAARIFCGVHDFSLFARVEGRDPVRKVLTSRVFLDQGLCVYEVSAESFLWHMVRYMASTLLMAGLGADGDEVILSRLAGDGRARLSPAPPEGLVLWDVAYAFPFVPVSAGEKALALLESRGAYHRCMGRVIDTLRDTTNDM